MARGDSWLLALSSAVAVGGASVLLASLLGPGCQTRCSNNFDCGSGAYCSGSGRCETECFTDLDCQAPPECQHNPTVCKPRGLRCNGVGRCVGQYSPARTGRTRATPVDDIDTNIEGWDAEPGSGVPFIINQVEIAGNGRGFDVDGVCTNVDDCVDNVLWQLGELGNDQIRQGLLGGESLLLIELAGLDHPPNRPEPYQGEDSDLTIKLYGARDADDPFFPANNFRQIPGHPTCCEFQINPQSISGPPNQARARAPARIERGRIHSLAPVAISFTLTVGAPPHPEIRIERLLMSARLPSTLTEINEGLLGGAVPINTLAQTENPYCRTVSPRCNILFTESTLIDLVATLLRPAPDIDLDDERDGLECVLDTDGDGRVDRCCDGAGVGNPCTNGSMCASAAVAPVDPTEPWSCALSPRVADGYSVGITFTAVQASIVGISD